MEESFFRIGGHPFALASADGLLPESFRPFRTPPSDGPVLFRAEVRPAGRPEENGEETAFFEWEETRCRIRRNGTGYRIRLEMRGDPSKNALMTANDTFMKADIFLDGAGDEAGYFLNNYLMMLYAFASAPHGTLLLHASVILSEGRGYLFLGRSGTGKSTHSSLWLKHIPGTRLLNDDNPVVRIGADGKTTVYGSPWSGKTPCYRNEQAEIGAFVRLEQAPENRIVRENAVRAFASLLPACSGLKENEPLYDRLYDTVGRVAASVPFFRLSCRPDREAALLCRENTAPNARP